MELSSAFVPVQLHYGSKWRILCHLRHYNRCVRGLVSCLSTRLHHCQSAPLLQKQCKIKTTMCRITNIINMGCREITPSPLPGSCHSEYFCRTWITSVPYFSSLSSVTPSICKRTSGSEESFSVYVGKNFLFSFKMLVLSNRLSYHLKYSLSNCFRNYQLFFLRWQWRICCNSERQKLSPAACTDPSAPSDTPEPSPLSWRPFWPQQLYVSWC